MTTVERLQQLLRRVQGMSTGSAACAPFKNKVCGEISAAIAREKKANSKTTAKERLLIVMSNTTQLTFGQKAVGLTFNPSGDDAVANCKQGFANLIDQMQELRSTSESSEQKRLASVAITEMQGAQMWAVKALTWKD